MGLACSGRERWLDAAKSEEVAQLGRRSAAGGRPGARRRIARDDGACWLGEALAAPGFHLLLRGRPNDRDARQLVAVRRCYASRLTVHHLTCDARPGRCMTSTGKRSRGG